MMFLYCWMYGDVTTVTCGDDMDISITVNVCNATWLYCDCDCCDGMVMLWLYGDVIIGW